MIWWLWTAFPPDHRSYVHIFDVDDAWDDDDPDVYWLGECAWVHRGQVLGQAEESTQQPSGNTLPAENDAGSTP